MLVRREWMSLAVLLTAPMATATGNVITDWDEEAVALVQPGTVFPSPTALRTTAMLHLAMFDAVNSIEHRYKPYGVQLVAAPNTSQEAPAASAAGAVLTGRFASHAIAVLRHVRASTRQTRQVDGAPAEALRTVSFTARTPAGKWSPNAWHAPLLQLAVRTRPARISRRARLRRSTGRARHPARLPRLRP
jgi:hypothetical protein